MYWFSDGVLLNSPTPHECVDVISQLTDIQYEIINLHSSSPRSTLVLLSQIPPTEIIELDILNTSLNEKHMYCISQCLLNDQLTTLRLTNTKLTSNLLSSLTAAVSINTSLERLQLAHVDFIENDVSCISKLLTVNKTLQSLSLIGCGISDSVVQSLSSSLLHNNTLTELDLRRNQFTSAGIQYLFHLLTTKNTIKRLSIDHDHKKSSQQLKEYTQIKNRLDFCY